MLHLRFVFVKSAIKKIISIFFLLLGLCPLLLVIFITVQKDIVRQRMKEKLETESLQTIVLAEKDIVWMDKHEIWVNNQLFDIHNRTLKDGVYTFTGLYDDDETSLVELQQNATDKDEEDDKSVNHFFKSFHTIFHNTTQEFYIFSLALPYKYCIASSSLMTQTNEIPTPPPQV